MSESDTFIQIIETARTPAATDHWIADLARQLAGSGESILDHSGLTADIPSTGGPSSLSTLLCPLFLAASGLVIPKLGVPGRPAGGLDVMAQIPGYRTNLDPTDVKAILAECRYAHFDAKDRIAPMDRELFAFRQVTGAQAIVPLVIASLLAKKIAVGVERVGLDIRASEHGNFGSTAVEVEENARKFMRVATLLGINATAFITDASRPYQPYIGRGEALLGLHAFFEGQASPWLSRHINQCIFMTAQLSSDPIQMEPLALRRQFDLHLTAQGANPASFDELVHKIKAQRTLEIFADRDGYINFDLAIIRDALVLCQRDFLVDTKFPDPAGVILLAEPDEFVRRGQPVMRVRGEVTNTVMALRAAIVISSFPKRVNVDVLHA